MGQFVKMRAARWLAVLFFLTGLPVLTGCDNDPTGSDSTDGCGSGPACVAGEQCMGGSCVRTVRGDAGSSDLDFGIDGVEDFTDFEQQLGPDMTTDPVEQPDTTTAETGGDVPDLSTPRIAVTIEVPGSGSVFDTGEEIAFVARVVDDRYEPDTLNTIWTSSRDGLLATLPPDGSGRTVLRTSSLSSGEHRVTVAVEALDLNTGEASVNIGICGWDEAESFDSDLSDSEWTVLGDASRDSRGWLEMTGNYGNRKGAIFNISEAILPGNIQLRFRISTGQCDEPGPCSGSTGADGFAMSVFAASDPDTLVDIVGAAHGGGGLGYGVSGAYGDVEVDAFHVEFDTWHNIYNGDTELHTDPTTENHVAITLDGDPGSHLLWAPYPTLEDNEWHDVQVTIDGIHVIVEVDSEALIEGDVGGLDFKGGYIGFSGVTGYYSNYHRFDELAVIDDSCGGD